MSALQRVRGGGKEVLDDSLTSLNWLHDIKDPFTADGNNKTRPSSRSTHRSRGTVSHTPGDLPMMPPPAVSGGDICCELGRSSSRGTSHRAPELLSRTDPKLQVMDFCSSAHVKPPYNYQQLVYMALANSRNGKLTLPAIYEWIQDNFMYYRVADVSWQSSVRHALSVSRHFERIGKRKNDCYWRASPNGEKLVADDMLISSTRGEKRQRLEEPDLADSLLRADDWDSVFQELEEGGALVSAEDLLRGDGLGSAFNPEESEDLGSSTLEELLLSELSNEAPDATDQDGGGCLDLTVAGRSIPQPEWWHLDWNQDVA